MALARKMSFVIMSRLNVSSTNTEEQHDPSRNTRELCAIKIPCIPLEKQDFLLDLIFLR